jgi:hypothetical protein
MKTEQRSARQHVGLAVPGSAWTSLPLPLLHLPVQSAQQRAHDAAIALDQATSGASDEFEACLEHALEVVAAEVGSWDESGA